MNSMMKNDKPWPEALDFIRGNIIYYFGEFSESLRDASTRENLKDEELMEFRKEIKWAISCFNSMKSELIELNDLLADGSQQ